MKALESGYSHKVKDAMTNLITTFEQEYPERTQDPEVAFLQLQVAAASIRYKRPIDESYQKRLASQVVFAQELGKWNYLVKPVN